MGSKDRSGGHVTFEPGAGKQYEWTLEYDPGAGDGNGAIAFSIGGQRIVKTLPPGEKARGAVLDRFGVFNMQWANSKWCDVYLDDLTYTTAIEPRRLSAGVHLFLDDDLVASQRNLRRTIHPPQRLPRPIVTGKEDRCFQPYVSVLRDPQSSRFRMWYNSAVSSTRSHVAHLESEDGIEWIRPHRELEDPGGLAVGFGACVVDDGPAAADPRRRYKLAWENGGLYTAFSPDGLTWTPSSDRPVLHDDMGDIISLSRDPIRNRYLLLCKAHSRPEDGYKGSTPNAQEGYRRLVGQSVSDDCVRWSPVRRIIAADDRDDGITEFYGIGSVIARGELLLGTLKVLRDDLAPEPGGEPTGIGYTVLAWTRDGETWQRDREPFLDRNPVPGTWDRAMTWGDCLLPVGDEVLLYYGGYARGHKVERFTERQLGVARFPQDRYVSRDAGADGGSLRTPVVVLEGAPELLVNAEVAGELRIRLFDAAGAPIPGLDTADCAPIRGDSLRHAVAWQRPLASVAGKPVQLEFVLRDARLYAFELRP
jgi:hypothetical protein